MIAWRLAELMVNHADNNVNLFCNISELNTDKECYIYLFCNSGISEYLRHIISAKVQKGR